ncbi:fungal-specific transcription factor domain-containing protein [Massariosphaeria phaeospora]|uniref:Fungal-specific transcription factor domain-containing protein n=1 Tax=Massariosphaeria phaeospora TaxID=100035 RepID=A0A7C8IG33_9PLEO|nr:fungal-specific transcription factor domain-containing protein [Massariosphaeria phaeospora]
MDSSASQVIDAKPAGPDQSGQYADSVSTARTPDIIDHPSSDDEDNPDSQPKLRHLLQKRRRVTRACDECRRKKIKCDGQQPCTHCTVYSYECTFDQPSNRRRNAAPQYVEALETQLKRAKSILQVLFPTLDLNDPSIDAHLHNGIFPQPSIGALHPQQPPHDLRMPHRREVLAREDFPDSHLESMVKATGNLDLDEEGNWEYHGTSSGMSFIKRLQQQFGDIIAPSAASSPFIKYRPMSQAFDSPSSSHHSSADQSTVLPSGTSLPPKEKARILCDNALNDAGALLRAVHLPTFYKCLDRVYEIPLEYYEDSETSFLPLLYAVLALGTLSRKETASETIDYESTIEEGIKYFQVSRQLLDIAVCRDLTSLQAIVFMIQFLQSSAKLSTCYSYIGLALRSALRMGLHRSSTIDFSPIEAETRKRVFWVIRKMDIYVSAMLGLPTSVQDEDFDQSLPTECDDEYITETEIRPMPEGTISVMAAANAHTKILQILSKICKYVYPIKGGAEPRGAKLVTYSVGYSKIREIERDLQQWLDQLPMALKPGGEAPYAIIRAQQLLRMSYGHAQLLLYRPFLHYVSQSYQNKPVDQRAFACASACISVSRNIVHISAEMKRKELLNGASWFSMYTSFFAIMSLLYFVLETPNSTTGQELFRTAVEGREVLAHFAKRSMAADRCTATLNTVFERSPMAVERGDIPASKKRRQASSPQSSQSRPNLLKQDEDFVSTGLKRSSTFPECLPNTQRTAFGQSLPISQTYLANLGPAFNSPQSSFDPTPSLTPTSSTSTPGGYWVGPSEIPLMESTHSNPLIDPVGLHVPLSDVSQMMFPSPDPLAYGIQPMTTFENNDPQRFGLGTGFPTASHLPSHLSDMISNSAGHSPSAQVVGPMPMYLMQGAPMASTQGARGFQPHSGPAPVMIPTSDPGNMNFDELFGVEDWANTFMDQSLGGAGLGGSSSAFYSGGPRMGPWR